MNYKKIIKGVFLVGVMYIIFSLLNDLLIDKFNLALETLTIGIILGILLNNTVDLKDTYRPGIRFSLKKLLKVGIILLGFKLNFYSLLKLGPKILIMVLVFVPLVLLVSFYLGKMFKLDSKVSTLIGIGSCICGTSAIVALGPSVGASEEDSVISVSIVSFLGAIGVLLYSFIATISPINNLEYGIWSGLSLQGVAHALAAAFARGEAAGEIGTFVKMARVVMLIPVSIAMGFIFKTDNNQTGVKVKFPKYVLLFILAGILNSLVTIQPLLLKVLVKSSSVFIGMAMIAMGLSVNFSDLKEKGKEALLLGLILFLIIALSTYYFIPMML